MSYPFGISRNKASTVSYDTAKTLSNASTGQRNYATLLFPKPTGHINILSKYT